MNDIKYVIDGFKSLKPILQAQVLKTDYEGLGVSDAEELGEHFNIAIKCMEKQIPKKPIRLPWSISRCPSCSVELGTWLTDGYHKDYKNLKVCDCGQKLDWSTEEDTNE